MPRLNPNPTPLEKMRKQKNMSRKKLCELTGLNYWCVKNYEIRRVDINEASYSRLKKIAKVLDCSIEDIVNPETDQENKTEGREMTEIKIFEKEA